MNTFELLGCQTDTCYHFFNVAKTWNDSRYDCQTRGGDLALIQDQVTQDFLSSKLATVSADKVWLGAKAVELDNWYWEDNSNNGFSRWTTGYPQQNMYVAEYNKSAYHWQDQISPCPYKYLCDGTTALSANVPSEYIKISPPSPQLCVLAYVGGEFFSWYQARSRCADLDTSLATVNNEDVFNSVQSELSKLENPPEAYWIGLHKENWIWIDGSYVTYNNWAPTAPSKTSSCMIMYQTPVNDYLWEDAVCTESHSYVCQAPYETTVSSATTSGLSRKQEETSSVEETSSAASIFQTGSNNPDIITNDVSPSSDSNNNVLPWCLFAIMTATSVVLSLALFVVCRRNSKNKALSDNSQITRTSPHQASNQTAPSIEQVYDDITDASYSLPLNTIISGTHVDGLRGDHKPVVNNDNYERLAAESEETTPKEREPRNLVNTGTPLEDRHDYTRLMK